MSKRGHWASHEYVRGNVERDAGGFVGWDYLEKNVFSHIRFNLNSTQKRAIIAAMFLTGGRISEVLGLRKENFVDFPQEPRLVVIQRMPLLKRYEKLESYFEVVAKLPVTMATGVLSKDARSYIPQEDGTFKRPRWKTKSIQAFRDVSFPRKEKFVGHLLPWVEKIEEGPLFSLKYDAVYSTLYRLEVVLHELYPTPRIYNPHWFRAQRACQLRMEYGFRHEDLKDFFQWKDDETASHYASLGGIATGVMMINALEKLEAATE